jgi:hypothetical protein
MRENEQLRAELPDLMASGDQRKRNRPHDRRLGRDAPGIDLPGL